jgi:PAS domain S-box-containing protein
LIVQANLTAATLLGETRDALIKQPVNHFILNEDQDPNYLYRKRLIETGESQSCELRIVKNDGTQFWAHVEAAVAWDVDGNQEIRVVLSDISAQKQVEDALRKSENRYRALVGNAGDAILIADMNGNLEEINRAGELLLGYNADEICRMSMADIHPPAEMAKVRQHFDEVFVYFLLFFTLAHRPIIYVEKSEVFKFFMPPCLLPFPVYI